MLETIIEAAVVVLFSNDRSVTSFKLRDVSDTNEIISNERKIEDQYAEITPLQNPGDLNEVSRIFNMVLIKEGLGKKICHYEADIVQLTIGRTYNI